MVRLVIFATSIICLGFSWGFSGRGPMPMDITTAGELLYPMSSGSNDISVLSFGLLTFIVTAIYTPVSALLNHRLKFLVYAYLANLALFLFFVALVSLDSSFIFAAEVGDIMPLISVLIAFMPIPVLTLLHLTSSSTGRSLRRAG